MFNPVAIQLLRDLRSGDSAESSLDRLGSASPLRHEELRAFDAAVQRLRALAVAAISGPPPQQEALAD